MDELRKGIYDFQASMDASEMQKSLSDRDGARNHFAVSDVADAKFHSELNKSIQKKYIIFAPSVLSERLLNFSSSIYSMKVSSNNESKSRCMTLAFENLKFAKNCNGDRGPFFSIAASYFDKLEIYDKAIEFFTKAIKPKSPELLVDTIQLPRSKEEERKLERLGKVQKQRYLENRDITRSQLIETEQLKQETRIQESHCNLLRIYLILANQMKPQIDAIHEDEMHETNTKLNLVSHTSRSKGSSSYAPSKKSTSIGVKAGAGHNASSSLLNANMSVSTSEKKVQSLKLQYSQYLASAHYHLRCAFKSINPVHQSSVRYHTILLMANEQILMLLPPLGQDVGGIYHHSVAGSAGPLQEAHIVLLHELIAIEEGNSNFLIQLYSWLAERYGEKCDFESAQKYFKKSRDLKEADRVVRYSSSTSLLRSHGGMLEDKNPTDRDIPVRELLGVHNQDKILRAPLLLGKELALRKVPMSLFGTEVERDATLLRKVDDFTVFPGKHVGGEARIFLPPSSGWGMGGGT